MRYLTTKNNFGVWFVSWAEQCGFEMRVEVGLFWSVLGEGVYSMRLGLCWSVLGEGVYSMRLGLC